MEVQFTNPAKRLANERRSKLLDPNSKLYQFLQNKRDELSQKYPGQVGDKRMDFHIELIKDGEQVTDELLVTRAQAIQGSTVQLIYSTIGKAYVLNTPSGTHITIAFFPKGVPKGI